MRFWHLLWWGLLFSSAMSFPLKAQITPDGTTDTTTTPIDNGIRIDEGNRGGDNLFHSFEQFSLPSNSKAFFNNSNGGIAPSPNQAREAELGAIDLVEPADSEVEEVGIEAVGETKEEITEAQGWMVNDRGIVELVAHKTSLNGSTPHSSVTCY